MIIKNPTACQADTGYKILVFRRKNSKRNSDVKKTYFILMKKVQYRLNLVFPAGKTKLKNILEDITTIY